MHQEFVHLGEIFRKRRETKNFSLKEVESATSIRHGHLEAIESGHLGQLISPIYAQGFIKQYASFLELDGDELIRQHPYVNKLLTDPARQSEELPFLGSIEVRGSPGTEVKWLPNLMWVALSAVVILLAWFGARMLGIF